MENNTRELLAVSSIRRLWWQRHDHGIRRNAPARVAIRQWLGDLRTLWK